MAIDRTGVLLIDMQPGFTEHLAQHDLERILAHQRDTLETCAAHDIPLWVVECSPSRYGRTIPELASAWAAVPRVSRFEKWGADAFNRYRGEPLAHALEHAGVTSLFLTGINACQCVSSTAWGARLAGFSVAVAPGGTACPVSHCNDDVTFWFRRLGTVTHSLRSYLGVREPLPVWEGNAKNRYYAPG